MSRVGTPWNACFTFSVHAVPRIIIWLGVEQSWKQSVNSVSCSPPRGFVWSRARVTRARYSAAAFPFPLPKPPALVCCSGSPMKRRCPISRPPPARAIRAACILSVSVGFLFISNLRLFLVRVRAYAPRAERTRAGARDQLRKSIMQNYARLCRHRRLPNLPEAPGDSFFITCGRPEGWPPFLQDTSGSPNNRGYKGAFPRSRALSG